METYFGHIPAGSPRESVSEDAIAAISLQYFSDIIKKVTELAIPESYWEPLRSKMMRMEQQW
jgi:hypothetical protein